MTQAQRLGADGTPQIRIYPGGPLIIRGDVELVGADGRVLEPRRRVVALCRCGRSALLPFCDGNHKQVASFTAEHDVRTSPRLAPGGAERERLGGRGPGAAAAG